MKGKRNVVKKTGAVSLWLMLVNVSFYVLAREVYSHTLYQISITLFCLFTCADLFIRPISTKKDEFRTSISAAVLLLVPFVLVLPFHEGQVLILRYLPLVVTQWISWVGIGFIIAGGILSLASRIQLGRYGSSKIVLENGHTLVTGGIYGHIRHPIYLGFLLLFLGFSLSFQSFIFTFLLVTGFFLLFKRRMDLEEKLLGALFGKEYEFYTERTNRLIPHVY
jgi:protein-S-isoprenylcysteine O-methyltransferase Ste14